MDRDGRDVFRGCRRISDLAVALHAPNCNRILNGIATGCRLRLTRNYHVGLERLIQQILRASEPAFEPTISTHDSVVSQDFSST